MPTCSAAPARCRRRCAQLFGWKSAADYWFPNVRSLGGAVLIMGFVLYPYVYLAARAMFQTQSVALMETARGLGASQWRLVRDIALPMARPAIAAGVALALLEALNDIGASEYLGVQTMTLSIFTTWLNRVSLPGAAQIACMMLVGVAALIALERYGRRRQGFTGLDRAPEQRAGASRLRARSGGLRSACCLVPVLLGFVVPFVYLARETILRGLRIGFDPALARHALSTVLLAGSATALILAIGFGAAFAVRLIRRRRRTGLHFHRRPRLRGAGHRARARAPCRRWSRSTKRSAAQRRP